MSVRNSVHLKNLEGIQMIDDPIVAEVRKHRQEHADEFGHNLKRIANALREREAKSKRPVLDPGPKYIPRDQVRNQANPGAKPGTDHSIRG